MAQEGEATSIALEAGLTPEGWEAFTDPSLLTLGFLGLGCYALGRFVIGRRDPAKPRRWWDYRRID